MPLLIAASTFGFEFSLMVLLIQFLYHDWYRM